MDEETRQATDDAFRDLAVGVAVREEAAGDPAVAAWLHKVLDRRVTDAGDRTLFGLKPRSLSEPEQVRNDALPDGEPEPHPGYREVVFRREDGVVVAFPWIALRSWVLDATGGQLVFIWPDVEVFLKGRRFDRLEEKIRRRDIGEFRQVEPGKAGEIAVGLPVIEVMQFEFKGSIR